MVFKVWRTWPNSKLICYSERGEPRLSFGYKFVGLPWNCIVLFPLRTSASWRSAKCTRRVLKVWSNWPNSKLICYSERGEPRLSFGYKFVGLPWKLLKICPTVHSYFFLYTVLYCFHWEHRQVEGVLSAHGGVFKVWRNFPNSKLICYSERGEPRLSFGYKFVGLSWKLLKLYPNVHSYFFFSSYSIVLFPLRTPASWRSAKCTRRVLKVWSHWPNSKLICYPERGTRRLSFGYKFVDLPWKLLKIYPTVHSYLFFSLHCIVLFPLRTSAS